MNPHTDTQVATHTHKYTQVNNGNDIVIMGLGETIETMAKVCQCFQIITKNSSFLYNEINH